MVNVNATYNGEEEVCWIQISICIHLYSICT